MIKHIITYLEWLELETELEILHKHQHLTLNFIVNNNKTTKSHPVLEAEVRAKSELVRIEGTIFSWWLHD